ncbi:MAG: alpha/beta fold hydrolase [Pseudomonadota bacterium]
MWGPLHRRAMLYQPLKPQGTAYDRKLFDSAAVENGIERISYLPARQRFSTPIVMQHGMWHGAWCWDSWQGALAEFGWESHSLSLPGHGRSPEQRPIRWCTLDYYLGFLSEFIEGVSSRPVLMGHSMGGALTQRYLKKVRDDLPAAVLVASWPSHSTFASGLVDFMRLDPWGGNVERTYALSHATYS